MNTIPALPGGFERVEDACGKVWHADALALLRALPDNSVDCVVTSPPYDNLRTYNGYSWDFEGIARETYRVMKPGGVVVWVVGDATVNGSETLTSMRQALYFVDVCGFRMHDTMIYQKDGSPFPESNRYAQEFEYMFVLSKSAPCVHNMSMTQTRYGASATSSSRSRTGQTQRFKYELAKPMRVMANVWYITSGYMKTTKDAFAYAHPAMFPEELAERHILTWTNPGEIVLDYFGGSGTTAKMARNNNRKWVTCDISAEYVQLAEKRLAQPYTPNMFETLLNASSE